MRAFIIDKISPIAVIFEYNPNAKGIKAVTRRVLNDVSHIDPEPLLWAGNL